MRELTVDLFITVDGWARGTSSPAYFGYGGPELDAWIDDQTGRPHVMLLGATTYRTLSGIAVGAEDTGSLRMTELPKVVFSRSLTEPLTWPNTTLVAEGAEGWVAAAKGEEGDPLRVVGSLSLTRSLLRAGLVDRYRVVVFPQILGATGAESPYVGLPDLDLELTGTSVLDGRLVVLEYAPVAAG
ncbi:dihydrofolate reductase family protein [Actinomycetospora endophytica]|uniref:Dihydrofolate reductase family protein n=1 Tax=Actinomycetospora endophytica TaxID=2291215 RepID=A0ABS8PE04_9PSEU|nr:dihydrofolate reductase family protein [Actinomycetospora endophytica]MCD2196508.1 dihydrofolate reductase family protein [Actinomycetospora endophytica]